MLNLWQNHDASPQFGEGVNLPSWWELHHQAVYFDVRIGVFLAIVLAFVAIVRSSKVGRR
jgi:hypothetical protein